MTVRVATPDYRLQELGDFIAAVDVGESKCSCQADIAKQTPYESLSP